VTLGRKLNIGVVGAAALIFAGLLVKEYFSAKATAAIVSQGDAKTGPEYDIGFKPVEVGRHYVGTVTDSEKPPPRLIQIRMAITALDQAQVTVEAEMPGQTLTWTGPYNPAERTLALKGGAADFLDIQYSNGGHWKGLMRLVKGRLPNGSREYASFPVQLSAGSHSP